MTSSPKVVTLCFVREGDRLLLGMKKRGFGAGKFNGFGGKIEAGETLEEAAKREIREECGLQVSKIEKRGILRFTFEDDPMSLEVHVFLSLEHSGEPIETEEMRPEWFLVEKIPFEFMWPDDPNWMPLFLGDKKFVGSFHFRGHDTILASSLSEVAELED